MSRPMCERCGVRCAQHYQPRRCRSCFTGRVVVREVGDDSDAVIEQKYQRALAEIRARNRPQPSREYRG